MWIAVLHRDEHVHRAQLSRAVAQLSSVGATWDARLRRIKKIAEAIQNSQPKPKLTTSTEGNDHA